MRTLLLIGWISAALVGALAYPVAEILAGGAVEAYIIAAKDPSAIDVDRQLFEPPKGASKDSKAYRDEVMRIYGSQTDEPTKVVFVAKDKFKHPEELPSLTLLPVDKQKHENPLQVKTLYFFASRILIGGGVAFVLLFLPWIFLKPKRSNPAA
jgi:hypothetical protein